MSNYVAIQKYKDAAFAVQASAAGAAGTWGAATYSFLVAAWYSADETDDEFMQFICDNPGIASDPQPAVYDGLVVTANQTVTLTWQPPRRRPHHYAVYVQTAATYDFDANGNKILPAAVNRVNGDIPGWATSAIFPNSTHVQRQRQVTADADDADDSYTVRGNRIISLHEGNVVQPFPTGGTQTIDDVEVGHDNLGEFTKIFVTSAVIASDGAVLYTESPVRVARAGGVTSLDKAVILDPVIGFDGGSSDFTHMTNKGHIQRNAQALPKSQDTLRITLSYTSFLWTAPDSTTATDESGMYQLIKWKEMGVPVTVTVSQDNDVSPFYLRWVCMILAVNDYGYKDMHDVENVELLLRVERYFETDANIEYWAIIAGTATDGLKAVSATPTYDSANDETDIVFTDAETASISGNLTAYLVTGSKMLVDDSGGVLQLWDRP